jgi:hydroxyquinol 1,2-dioxygenase
MRDLNEHTLTDEVISRFRNSKSPRAKQVSEALVRHLHAFIREIEPTQKEWEFAIDFLTRTGHMCDDKRQEFILLSDTLGASMLVDAINHRQPEGVTESTVFGPFYVAGAKEYESGADLSEGVEGQPMLVTGTVSNAKGQPIAGATVNLWQADTEGFYDVQHMDSLALRGVLHTNERGQFSCWTVRPAPYPIPDDGPVGQMLEAQGRHPWRPAHVHFMLEAPGYEKLVTHVFADNDPYLDSDVVFGVKNSLIRDYTECPPGTAPDGRDMTEPYAYLHYDFRLKAV